MNWNHVYLFILHAWIPTVWANVCLKNVKSILLTQLYSSKKNCITILIIMKIKLSKINPLKMVGALTILSKRSILERIFSSVAAISFRHSPWCSLLRFFELEHFLVLDFHGRWLIYIKEEEEWFHGATRPTLTVGC